MFYFFQSQNDTGMILTHEGSTDQRALLYINIGIKKLSSVMKVPNRLPQIAYCIKNCVLHIVGYHKASNSF